MQLIQDAVNYDNKQSLFERAGFLNDSILDETLEEKEVEKIVNSVWRYKQQGKLFTKGKQRLVVDMEIVSQLRFKHSRALDMYIDLLAYHRGVNATFAISPKAYAKRCGWSAKTAKEQRDILLHYGLIECVKKGGRYKGDVAVYRF